MRETMTQEFLLSVQHLEHPSLQQAYIYHLLVSMCTQPTHSAQQQQHAAHHNGYHDGQLTAAELHFGDGVTKVPHLHLRGKKGTTHFLLLVFFYSSHHYNVIQKHISSCHIYSLILFFINHLFFCYCSSCSCLFVSSPHGHQIDHCSGEICQKNSTTSYIKSYVANKNSSPKHYKHNLPQKLPSIYTMQVFYNHSTRRSHKR